MPLTTTVSGRLCLVVLSILLSCLSNPGMPASLSWLAWVCLVPLFIAVRNLSSPLCAGLFFCWGLGWWAWSISWLTPAISDFTGSSSLVATAAWFGLSALLALPYALTGLLYPLIRSTTRPIINALLAALLFACCYANFAVLMPASIAQTQFQNLLVIQLADIGGVGLILFFMVAFNGLIANLLPTSAHQKPKKRSNIIALTTLLIIVLGYGYYGQQQYQPEKAQQQLAAGFIQPNFTRLDKTLPLITLTEQLVDDSKPLDLIIWPEFPPAFSWQEDVNDRQRVSTLVEHIHTPILLNSGYVYAPRNARGKREGYYNSNQLIAASGELIGNYHKQQLVPFFEYLPLLQQLPNLSQWFPDTLNYKAGPSSAPLEVAPNIFAATPICYEILFPEPLRKHNFDVIINPSNDGWFDHDSRASISHLALGVFRAIEYRSPWLRVSNSGISQAIDSRGALITDSRLNSGVASSGSALLPLFKTQTLYRRYGNDLANSANMLTLFALFIAYRKRRSLKLS